MPSLGTETLTACCWHRNCETLRDKNDAYLFHDHLEAVNDPVYFHEFMDAADRQGLVYLAEAEYRMTATGNVPPQVEAVLAGLSDNLLEVEQYMDFVRNRMFRQTLLCRSGVDMDRRLNPRRIEGMWVASNSRLDDGAASRDEGQTVRYVGPSAVMTTNDRIVKGAMDHLAKVWPARVIR